MNRVMISIAIMVMAMTLAGCEAEIADGPPNIRFGTDECIHCGMIISDARSACASIIVVDGKRQALLFDDIGDMVKYHQRHPELAVHGRYVADYVSRNWIDFDRALYVHAPEVQTPMGSGLLAFTTEAAAAEAVTAHGGRRIAVDALLKFGSGQSDEAHACCMPGDGE